MKDKLSAFTQPFIMKDKLIGLSGLIGSLIWVFLENRVQKVETRFAFSAFFPTHYNERLACWPNRPHLYEYFEKNKRQKC